ncbi:CmcJ/NvfI family oxidoreductase [Billgrantia sp. Q4P2]|uniref:CmcJ/NvfI family oxidoreductase n=1 Tax=Billgrantia sp. Q4P2 TaxID=3463857 RepID=UPI004056695D
MKKYTYTPEDSNIKKDHIADTSSILAKLSYLKPTEAVPTHFTFTPPDGLPWENVDYEEIETEIFDARLALTSLDKQGFELWEAPSKVINFDDEDEVKNFYYKEIEQLIKSATGADEVIVFDHLVRQRQGEDKPLNFGRREGKGSVVPANGRIHNDYTDASGSKRLELVIDSLESRQKVKRYSIINVWRSIGFPIIDAPLAVCDSRSISALDLVRARVIYTNREGEIYVLKHSPSHLWYYYSNMAKSEALIFKQYDTNLNGVSRFTPHAAFKNPINVTHQMPRKSIEARCIAIHKGE